MGENFLYRNSLSLVLMAFFFLCITGQMFAGWHEYNENLRQYGAQPIAFPRYFRTGHFFQATFENWESEFLQMGMYVLLTVSLRQAGSSESKKIGEKEEVDREPDPTASDAPWPVKKGGFILMLYKNSLSIAFALLFALSFCMHAYGSLRSYNEEQVLMGKQMVKLGKYMLSSRFWFESFQNWQSEFIAVTSIVVLSIFLRQKGSPESKPVDAPHSATGGG